MTGEYQPPFPQDPLREASKDGATAARLRARHLWPRHNPARDYGIDAANLGLRTQFKKYIKKVDGLFVNLCSRAYEIIQKDPRSKNDAAEIQVRKAKMLVRGKINRPLIPGDMVMEFSEEAFDNIFLPFCGLHSALFKFIHKMLDERANNVPVEAVVIRGFQSGMCLMDQTVQGILRSLYPQAMRQHQEMLRQDARNLKRTVSRFQDLEALS